MKSGKTSAIKRLLLWSLKLEPRIAFRGLRIRRETTDAEDPSARTSALSVMRLEFRLAELRARGHGSNRRNVSLSDGFQLCAVVISNAGQWLVIRIWEYKFSSTIQAHLVCPLLNCEHAAEVTVMTAKGELKHPT